jgi:thiamine-phosphate pyrophosphorylase
MELIVISNPFAIADEAKLINTLFRAGLKCFHLRKPENDLPSLKELLRDIETCFHDRIALHQFHEMAGEFGIKRLHYTESLRQRSNLISWAHSDLNGVRKLIAAGFTLSTSIHDIKKLPEVDHFHYVFYGPVFNSISKAGYQSKLPEDFQLDKEGCKTKVMALGGIQTTNLLQMKKMGFDGAAVLGTIWNEPHHAVERFNQLKEQLLFEQYDR